MCEKLWLNLHVTNATSHSLHLYLTSKNVNHRDLSMQVYSVKSKDFNGVNDCGYNG